ncbi:MAG: 30S ribosomal protein S16, partial [Planctomycetes bacterium]|nr:30S ribosomal protein S16 [Planctomycetota bacterium]
MVVLRLKRFGRRHRPFYRLCAMDQRVACNGKAIEELGWYDPIAPEERQVKVNVERID